MDVTKRIQSIFRAATSDYLDEPDDKIDDNLSPNMRALRLAMALAETLAAMGVSVADVVTMGLDITDRYCKRKVQFDINSTLIIVSQYRGNEMEPLTLTRQIAPRGTNNMLIQSLQELARDIHHRRLTLEDAEVRLEEILQHPKSYPYWLTTIGSALISSGVGILLGAKLPSIAIMFFGGAAVAYLVRVLSHKRVPLFFVQIFSSLFITIVAALTSLLSKQLGVEWLKDVEPTFIIVGGIIMLVAGLAIVGAVEDAIDEFYVTANAKLLKVIMMTVGIVAGVLLGLYLARKMGIYINLAEAGQNYIGSIPQQTLGASIIAAGYALSTQTGKSGIVLAGGLGALGWISYQAIDGISPLSGIVASGIAAIIIGAAGTLISRASRVPSIGLMTAGIVPLVPGLTLYNGLFSLVGNASSTSTITDATQTLFTATLIALALASGVSFGHLIARPVRRTLVRARNSFPKHKFLLIRRRNTQQSGTIK